MKTKLPQSPKHLSKEAKEFWKKIVDEYSLENHQIEILTSGLEAWDRCRQAKQILDKDGLCFIDQNGNPRSHPMLTVERDYRQQFIRAMRELCLSDEPEDTRPPLLSGYKNK